jgi:hypothetical protein
LVKPLDVKGFTLLSHLLWEGAAFCRGHPLYYPATASRNRKHRSKQEENNKLKLIAATSAAHFNPSHINTGIYRFGFYRENRFAVGRQCTIVPSHLIDIN